MIETMAAWQIQINNMDQKLDEHGDDLKEIRKTLGTIAVQSEQIQNITSIQREHHTQIETIRNQLGLMMNWQSGCPRKSVSMLWGFFWALVLVFLGAFVAHLMKGVGP